MRWWESQEVKASTSVTDVDHFGLRRMERQLQTGQDNPDPPKGLVRLCLRPAQQDGIVGIPDQLTQLTTAVLPNPIQLVEHHIRKYA